MARSALGWCWLLAATAGWLPAGTTLTGPVAGYVAESSGAVRAILGVPGAFRFSDPLPMPDGVARVHIAPGQDFALLERPDTGLALLHLGGGTLARVTAVDGAMPAPDWISFSPASASAILFSSSSNRLQVLAGLPDAPTIAVDLDTTILPEQPRIAAVSDDSRTLLVASRRAVYLVLPDGTAHLLMAAEEIAALALFRNGTDAAVSERGTGSIHLLQNVSTAPVERVLASGLQGLGKLYPSWDGGAIFAAGQGTRTVSSIDLASGEIQSIDCGAAPVTLSPMRSRDTFLISARPHQPGWIFYRDGNAGRVVFVPAAPETTESVQ